MLNKKQKLYLDILDQLLPVARNVQTWGVFSKLFKGDLYPELELVHNIPRLIKNKDFKSEDIHWFNYQASSYLNIIKLNDRYYSKAIKANIIELLSLVPESLKIEITIDNKLIEE